MKKLLTIKNVGKILPAFVFILSFLFPFKVFSEYKLPDFAFPISVAEKNDSILKDALRQKDDLMALRAIMNLTVATGLLDNLDTNSTNLVRIDSVASLMSTPFNNLAYLLEAEILTQLYSQDKGLYDERNLPLDMEFPADPEEWSGSMFKTRVLNLIEKASSNLPELPSRNISEISLLLTNYDFAQQIGLSVSEFIAFKAVAILKNFTRTDAITIIPFYPAEVDESVENKSEILAISLLNLIKDKLSGDNSVIKAIAVKEMLSFLPDNKKENYLKDNINDFKGQEGEGLLIYTLWNNYSNEDPSIYSSIKDWLALYPQGYGNEQLRFAEAQICMKRIESQFPKISLPATPIKGTVNLNNINQGYLLVYRLENGQYDIHDGLILKKFSGVSAPLKVIEINDNKEVPFSTTKDVEIPGLGTGLYVVIPSLTKKLPRGWNKATPNVNYSTIRVSDIAILTSFDSNEKDSGRVYVVKGADQQPVTGATVTYYIGENKKGGRLTTNKDGWVKIPNGYYRIEASYGNNIAKSEAGFSYYPENNKSIPHATILTDLAIYHPGDTVKFAVIGWQQEKNINSILKNCKVEISLRDAGYSQIGNLSLMLNDDGRASGEIAIPKGRLLGNYQLIANYPDFPGMGAGASSFLVEEYKLPAFLVTLEQIKNSDNKSSNSDTLTSETNILKFNGNALTYAGMPVTNAEVNIKVEYIPWRWGFMGQNASFSQSLSTNENGEFEIELPLSGLKDTPFERGRFSIAATVTSEAGETQMSRPLLFYLGNENEIRPNIKDKIKVSEDSIRFSVPVYDMAGLPENVSLEYRFTDLTSNDKILSGSFTSPILSVPSASLPSGHYKLEFKTKNSENWTTTETILWRSSDKTAPYPTPLWIPENQLVYDTDADNINVSFGSYWKEWLLLILSDGNKEILREWIAPEEGLINKSINVPTGNPTLFINLAGMHDFYSETAQISIIPQKNLEKMEISTSSFRDQITAGDEEDWTFNFKTGNKVDPFVNVFAVMSDKALNALNEFKWGLNIWKPGIYNKVHLSSQRFGNGISYKSFDKLPILKASKTLIPNWETYGYPLVATSGLRINSPMLYKAQATRKLADSASGAIITETADEAIMENAEAPKEVSEKQEVELRPVEMSLAFFMTDLKSNENGEVNLKFKVPNFNTTWQLQIAGYNTELLNSTLVLDAVASKPVMVKSNLPQYLRTGDKAEISATIFNNSDKEAQISGDIEIIDPLSGVIIANQQFSQETLKPMSNRVISIMFEVPADLTSLAVRAIAKNESHSDGEQGLIPVLPSSTPVTEATTFYAKTTDEEIIVRVPKLNKQANVTLKYCDNPLWEVLLSLPALTSSSNSGSLSIANWLYGTLTAKNIIDNNFEIAVGLQKILKSEDSTLSQSNLQKDENLKIAALEATPWLNDAAAQTSRIRSLNKYFDSTNVNSQIESKIKSLAKFQMSDGGWSWFEGMKSSPFITSQIIGILAYLNQNGWLSNDLKNMAKNAVNYYDSYLIELKNKNIKINPISITDYLYSRNKLGFGMNNSMKRIVAETLDSIAGQWRHWNPGRKAKAALVLNSDIHYSADVKLITESLTQFIGARLSLDQEALLLELFQQDGNYPDATESIREKMLLQKETEEWSDETNMPAIIYSLISTSSNSSFSRRLPDIYIDDVLIDLPESQSLIGNYTINLDPKLVSGKKITIKRESGIPAWGGVISQYIRPIKEVNSAKVENLAIEKRIYKEDSKGKLKEVSSFKKGDKITVVLNITCRKDMDYIALIDSRSACLQPDDRISGISIADGLFAYKEIRSDKTSFFIENMSSGKYVISYECHADRDGEYSLGIAEIQSLYSPAQTAHSSGNIIKVWDSK